MVYLKAKAVKMLVNKVKRQITKDGLVMLDKKVEEMINKVLKETEQKKTRINAEIVSNILVIA